MSSTAGRWASLVLACSFPSALGDKDPAALPAKILSMTEIDMVLGAYGRGFLWVRDALHDFARQPNNETAVELCGGLRLVYFNCYMPVRTGFHQEEVKQAVTSLVKTVEAAIEKSVPENKADAHYMASLFKCLAECSDLTAPQVSLKR